MENVDHMLQEKLIFFTTCVYKNEILSTCDLEKKRHSTHMSFFISTIIFNGLN